MAVWTYEKIGSRHDSLGQAKMGVVHQYGTKQIPFGL
jgi:hypothetical protein